MTLTKSQFKRLWESNDEGGGITNDDVADCAKEWGLYPSPRTARMEMVLYSVLNAAKVIDAEDYNPYDPED